MKTAAEIQNEVKAKKGPVLPTSGPSADTGKAVVCTLKTPTFDVIQFKGPENAGEVIKFLGLSFVAITSGERVVVGEKAISSAIYGVKRENGTIFDSMLVIFEGTKKDTYHVAEVGDYIVRHTDMGFFVYGESSFRATYRVAVE